MVTRPSRLHPPVECVRLHDVESGLDGVIAIHSTALGPVADQRLFEICPL